MRLFLSLLGGGVVGVIAGMLLREGDRILEERRRAREECVRRGAERMDWLMSTWMTLVQRSNGTGTAPAPRRPLPNHRAVEECEVCGEPADHRVVEHATDDARLAGGRTEGGTAMAADFCAAHCPGGCLRGCVPSAP